MINGYYYLYKTIQLFSKIKLQNPHVNWHVVKGHSEWYNVDPERQMLKHMWSVFETSNTRFICNIERMLKTSRERWTETLEGMKIEISAIRLWLKVVLWKRKS